MRKVRKFICGTIEQNNMCKGKITYLLFGETNQTQNANCNKVIIKWNLQHNKGVKKSWSQIAKNIKKNWKQNYKKHQNCKETNEPKSWTRNARGAKKHSETNKPKAWSKQKRNKRKLGAMEWR